MAEPDGTNTAYTFDTQGNIMTKTVTHPASYEFAFTQNGTGYSISGLSTHQFLYAYDKNNRLIMETEHVAGVGEDYAGFLEITKQNEYDNNGNLLKTIKGGQIDESVVEYAYNPLNQLTAYTHEDGIVTSYTYNPDGLRNSKTQNGNTTKFYWDRGYMSAESIGGTFTAKNHIGATGVFARETATGIDYMLKNGHGDVTTLVNNGIATQTYDYDAYGVQKNINANDTNPFRYAGEYLDSETGLIYLRNRYYDNSMGRFITEDPHWNPSNMIYGDKVYEEGEIKIPELTAILQANNLYVYALNNPMVYVDPSGETGIDVATILLVNAFMGNGAYKDFSYNTLFTDTLRGSPLLNKEVNKRLNEFKVSGMNFNTLDGSISFYGNDLNMHDLDLHLGIGRADYVMEFKKETVTKNFLWNTWTETEYLVKITISDRYNFDDYREGEYFSDFLNNWGYDWQKSGSLVPYYWSATFTKKGLE